MDSITLAIARNAHGGLYAGHFGDADFFAAYTLRADGSCLPGRVVPNTSKTMDESHGARGKMKSVLARLAPLHCVVAARISPNFKRMAREAPVQPVVVRFSSEDQLLACLSRECTRLIEWVAQRRQGTPLPDVPVLDASSDMPSGT
ncbi:MAG: NifB/NifX family molybdenum-iron cluster-binding protein [Kiritimatiellae bacterium]|nr:NifB/NifX family molybdenum-iron cluster-binding protein [Kiritimatiellia bacterium]